jgi:preprotein translocase subunit SecD
MMQLSRWKVWMVVGATLLALFLASPNVLPASVLQSLPSWMPSKKLNLGLDLQGGSYLLMEVDTAALSREKLNDILEDVRSTLVREKIPMTGLANLNGAVVVRITDPAQYEAAYKALNAMARPLPTGGADMTIVKEPDQQLRVIRSPDAQRNEASQAVDHSKEIIERRIDELGNKELSMARQGANRIVLQAPGESDPERLKQMIGKTAKLTFHDVDLSVPVQEAAATGRIPPGSMLLTDDAGTPYLIKRRPVVTGEMLTGAQQEFDQRTNEAVVGFRFNTVGARKFGEYTARNVGRPFAIVLDEKVVSAPVINSAITGGSGIITGNFTAETANDLAILLRAGALPAPLNVEQQSTVGPQLGAEAVQAGKMATLLAFVGVLIFMVLTYGLLFGGISVVALVVNGVMIIAAMSFWGATLTLPGIAGLILTLAAAVDANVLIYERMRDEVRAGRSALSAMDAGFSRAMVTIFDANLTTIIAALIMFVFGAGPVRGFAWTLSIGVITSVFTAVYITQVLLALWFRLRRPKTLPIA